MEVPPQLEGGKNEQESNEQDNDRFGKETEAQELRERFKKYFRSFVLAGGNV